MHRVASTAGDPRRNALLAALPDDDWERVRRHLQPLFLARGQTLYEPGAQIEHVCFPTTAIVSLVYLLADGASDEIAMVGNEGVVGVTLITGGGVTPDRAVLRNVGWAYGLRRPRLDEEFSRGGALQHLLLCYVQALIMQVAQLAVCNRHHSIDQQLCRWLLLNLDRQTSNDQAITHERIAGGLGVRREGITEAVGKLQRAGLIRHGRGHLTVLDRAGLEARACECYGVVKRESERLLALSACSSPAAPQVAAGTQGRRRARPDADARDVPAGAAAEVGMSPAAEAHQ
jgi:CRP-like cAMP-binding protein